MITTHLLPLLASAAEVAQPIGDNVGSDIKNIVDLAGGGAWGGAIGIAIMLIIAIAGKFKLLDWVPADGKRWVAMGVSVAAAVAAGLMGDSGWQNILGAAMTAGLSAVGGWEFVGKAMFGAKPGDEAKAE
jgi:hypothetical protein